MTSYTTADAIATLRAKHPADKGRWAVLVEWQRVDVLAVATWASAGYAVHGYEVKVSRSDWRRELAKGPVKSEQQRQHVDHWWLACPPGVVAEGELPAGWGHLELRPRGGTRVCTPAPLLRGPYDRATGWGPTGWTPEWRQREAVAMLARRVAYAEADRAALLQLEDMDQDATRAALDLAARRTGRVDSGMRERALEWSREQRAAERHRRQHRRHQDAGELYDEACPTCQAYPQLFRPETTTPRSAP